MSNNKMTFKDIRQDDSWKAVVDKIQYNFEQVLYNGGGRVGDRGPAGIDGLIGGTGKLGPKGDTGVRGSLIFFEAGPITNNSVIGSDKAYLLGDVVITSTGDYFKIENNGALQLIYSFKYNFSLSPTSYFTDQATYDGSGQPVGTWHTIAAPTSKESNIMLVKKITSGQNDESNFYRLLLGLDAYPVLYPSTLTIANITPHEVGGVAAPAGTFAQITLKYRPTSRDNPTVNSVTIKYVEASNIWTTEVNNAGVKMQLVYDNVTPANSYSVLESFTHLFKSPVGGTAICKIDNASGYSQIRSTKDLQLASEDASGRIVIQPKVLHFGSSSDTDITSSAANRNAQFKTNVQFNNKVKKASSEITIISEQIDITDSLTKPVIYIKGGIILKKVIGGDDNDVVILSVVSTPVRLRTTSNPLAGEIYSKFSTQINPEFEIAPGESVTLYKKSGSVFWTCVGGKSKNTHDFTAYDTQNLTYTTNPMEGFVNFVPGFYKVTGANTITGGATLFPATAYDSTNGCILQIINVEETPGAKHQRLFYLHKADFGSSLSNEIWVCRGVLDTTYRFSPWERLIASRTTGVNEIVDFNAAVPTVLTLSVGADKMYQHISGGLNITTDRRINVVTGVAEGSEFVLHFDAATFSLGGRSIIITENYGTGSAREIKRVEIGDLYTMLNKDGGITITLKYNGTKWLVTENYELGVPFKIEMWDGDVTVGFDNVGNGKIKGLFGYSIYTIMQGRTPVGFGSITENGTTRTFTMAEADGFINHTLTRSELPAVGIKSGLSTNAAAYRDADGQDNIGAGTGSGAIMTENLGSGVAHNNMQPYYVLAYIKKQF
jgi:hypothetical protein